MASLNLFAFVFRGFAFSFDTGCLCKDFAVSSRRFKEFRWLKLSARKHVLFRFHFFQPQISVRTNTQFIRTFQLCTQKVGHTEKRLQPKHPPACAATSSCSTFGSETWVTCQGETAEGSPLSSCTWTRNRPNSTHRLVWEQGAQWVASKSLSWSSCSQIYLQSFISPPFPQNDHVRSFKIH